MGATFLRRCLAWGKRKFTQFRTSEDGAFAIMAAVSTLMLVMCVGVAVDINRYHQNKALAQSLSDNIGLTAAIYMRDHNSPPKNSTEGYMEGKAYNLSSLSVGPNMNGISGRFTVNYNDADRQVEVTINSTFKTSFMGAFNVSDLEVRSNSTIKYLAEATKPASVFLVVDNSGSMAWDDKPLTNGSTRRPAGAKTRIQGLRETATKFNDDLGSSLGGNASTHLRMALVPYSKSVNGKLKKDPAWRNLNRGALTSLIASGGTDSRPPLQMVDQWMKYENTIHQSVNEEKNPNKYVIFMTDGSNNEEQVCDWQNARGTKYWRRATENGYEYKKKKRSPGAEWVEGYSYNCRYENLSNVQSLETCDSLKKKDVEIFTIGFALEPGSYYSDYPQLRNTTTISKATTDSAYAFLAACASSEDHFIRAENTAGLESAFDKIGKKISEDTIRIAN